MTDGLKITSVDLDDFKLSYQRMCKEHHIDPHDSVLKQIQIAHQNPRKCGGHSLDLSTLSLSSKTCAVLGKLFACSTALTEIRFNDCALQDDGVRAVAYGITENISCRRLELKGNSIRGPGAEALGRMLRQNTKLLCLCLEWNSVGLMESVFSVFCEGLSGNLTLQVLDLRSNQISHQGATELASALKRNSTLKCLDLRWNNVGLLGGRELLKAFDYNKTLARLSLAGNNVPTDVLKAIETAVGHNMDRATLTSDHLRRQHILSSEIQELNKGQRNEMIQLLDKIDRQEGAILKTQKSSAEKVCRLQDALEQRKEQFNDVITKLSLAESELSISESRVNELSRLLQLTKDEQSEAFKHHQMDAKRDKEERLLLETRLNKELMELSEAKFQLEKKVDDSERKCRIQQEQVFELKESLAHYQAELKLKQAQFDEMIQFEKQKTKEAYRDADNLKAKEIERIRKEQEEAERMLKDRLQRVESQRLELEEEVSRQKSNMAADRIQMDEQVASAKQRVRNEEEHRRVALEEKMRVLQAGRDELQTQSLQQTMTISDLQSRNSQIAIENETLKRRIVDLQQELSGKNAEMMEEVGKVRMDLTSRITSLENDRKSKDDLYNRISALEKELAELSTKYRSTVDSKDQEIQTLQDKLKMRDTEIRQMRDADTQRSSMLQTAVQSYINRSPYIA